MEQTADSQESAVLISYLSSAVMSQPSLPVAFYLANRCILETAYVPVTGRLRSITRTAQHGCQLLVFSHVEYDVSYDLSAPLPALTRRRMDAELKDHAVQPDIYTDRRLLPTGVMPQGLYEIDSNEFLFRSVSGMVAKERLASLYYE